MSLGLYVSSFYFFRSGKNSCYLGLNAPVQYNDTQYSQAIDFFEDFFEVRRTMETLRCTMMTTITGRRAPRWRCGLMIRFWMIF